MIDYADLRARLVKFRSGVLITGIVWGSAGILLSPSTTRIINVFIIHVRRIDCRRHDFLFRRFLSSALYSISTLSPISIRLLTADDSLSMTMGLAVLSYLIFLVVSLHYINKNVIGNILLNYETAARAEEARASEERYRLLFNNSPFPTWVIDASNLRFLDVNERAVEHYGYSKKSSVKCLCTISVQWKNYPSFTG